MWRLVTKAYLVVQWLGLEACSIPDAPLGVQREDLVEQLGLAGELGQGGVGELFEGCVVGDEESELVLLNEAGECSVQA